MCLGLFCVCLGLFCEQYGAVWRIATPLSIMHTSQHSFEDMHNLFSITHTCITACARHAAEEVAAEEEEEEERLASAAAAVAWAIGARRRCW